MATPEDFIDTFYHSICDLHLVRYSLDKEYGAGLIKIMQCAAEEISDHSGKFLHPLGEKNPDEDTLQNMMISASIDTFYHSIRDLHSVRYSLGIEYGAGLVKIL